MTSRAFAVLVAVASIGYAVGIFFWFSEMKFAAFSSVYLGSILAAVPFVLESRLHSALDSAQVAQYLYDSQSAAPVELVAADRLRAIRTELQGIRCHDIPLHRDLVDEYALRRLHEVRLLLPKSRYIAIHIVNSPERAQTWERDPSHDPWVYHYVAEQKAIVDSGGNVTRIFLFDTSWLMDETNRLTARRVLDRHSSLFGADATFASYVDSRSDEEDFTVLNDREAFAWRVHPGPADPRRSGRYVTDPSKVAAFVRKFDALQVAAKTAVSFQKHLTGPDSAVQPTPSA